MADKPLELGSRDVERVTGIESALSAWESDRSGASAALSWAADIPLVTVIDPATPGLMALQWPKGRQRQSADRNLTFPAGCKPTPRLRTDRSLLTGPRR
jgi:hypothetical protein